MRPAQKAPENVVIIMINETGKQPASMRPAQKAPENKPPVAPETLLLTASMRPAQKAPENMTGRASTPEEKGSFNEAGAKSAGKQLVPDRCRPHHQ